MHYNFITKYNELLPLAKKIATTNSRVNTAINCMQNPVAKAGFTLLEKISSAAGGYYRAPDLEQTLQLQVQQVGQYNEYLGSILTITRQYKDNIRRQKHTLIAPRQHLNPQLARLASEQSQQFAHGAIALEQILARSEFHAQQLSIQSLGYAQILEHIIIPYVNLGFMASGMSQIQSGLHKMNTFSANVVQMVDQAIRNLDG
jgi:hypothetical protein